MRHLLTAVLGMALAGTAMAADQAPTVTPSTDSSPGVGTSGDIHPVNTVCLVCGSAVDLEREPVALYDAESGTWLTVGVDNDAHAEVIRQQPAKYAKAARANSRLSDLDGSASGMAADEDGKPADVSEVDPLDRQDRAGAHEFNHPMEGGGFTSGNVGKEAAPESADSAYHRQGRASALHFNRWEQQDQTMSGSSAGMQSGQDEALSPGKPADRRDYDPIDQGRANALMFNQHERDLDDRRQALEEGRRDYAD